MVTGAGRGIGQGIALCLAEAGADVALAARTPAEIEETAQGVRKLGRKAIIIPTDVTQADQVENLVQRSIKEFGQIDVMVNNAGRNVVKPLVPLPEPPRPLLPQMIRHDDPISLDEWRMLVDTNLTGIYLCCRAVGPHMLARRQGNVINMASYLAARGRSYATAYSATKGGVAMLTRSLALEWAKFGVRVNAIGPGLIATSMNVARINDPQYRRDRFSQIPMGRAGTPREVGLLAVYLASDASSFMTGQVVYLDGGVMVE
ncbi:MAG: SDR family NAD(P)-dependent oxidoreductase [Chloroflexota bacterium]|nr:SDR family NAD(P)-dependent oxidoreductase [Chloroflexota bacterium]